MAGNAVHEAFKQRTKLMKALAPKLLLSSTGTLQWSGDTMWLQNMIDMGNKIAAYVALYSAARPLCRHEVVMLEKMAVDLGFSFPEKFPAESITYKMHLMFCHVHVYAALNAPFGRSPGMDNEQGIEASHKLVAAAYKRHKVLIVDERNSATMQNMQWTSVVSSGASNVSIRMCPTCTKPNSKRFDFHCMCIKTK